MNHAQEKCDAEVGCQARLVARRADSDERVIAVGFFLAMRSRQRIANIEDLARAAGFVLFEASWTAYYGLRIALKRGLSLAARELAIARGVALSLVEWSPGLCLGAVELELRALFVDASASAFSAASAS